MIISETIIAAIVDEVIAYAFEKSADKLGERVRERLVLDPTKKALKEALGQAFERLSRQHPQWVADNFDTSFFEYEGAPVIAQFLVMDGHPDASTCISRAGKSLSCWPWALLAWSIQRRPAR